MVDAPGQPELHTAYAAMSGSCERRHDLARDLPELRLRKCMTPPKVQPGCPTACESNWGARGTARAHL